MGLATTPSIGIYVKTHSLSGGVVISASHNGIEWNALKLLNDKGEFLSKNIASKIINADTGNYKKSNQQGKYNFDKNALEYFLKCKVKNIFDTKIASKVVRTYTDQHGLKNLVYEFCNKNLDKRVSSSDWNKDINELSDKQLEYASNDVIFLHRIKNELEKMLKRENRMDLYKNCITFLDTRIKLDQSGFKFDVFEH